MSRNYSEKPSNGRSRQTSEKTRAAESPAAKSPMGAGAPAPAPSAAKPSIPSRPAPAPSSSQTATMTAPRTSTATAAGRGATPTHEQIADRAKQIWMKSGCQPGHDRENWLEAERQVRDELNRR
jgi:hypothetical protein